MVFSERLWAGGAKVSWPEADNGFSGVLVFSSVGDAEQATEDSGEHWGQVRLALRHVTETTCEDANSCAD